MLKTVLICVLVSIHFPQNFGATTRATPAKSANVIFVVEDTNWSPDASSEKQVKDFLLKIVDRFDIDSDAVRVALQKFNDVNVKQFSLNTHLNDKSGVKADIQKANFDHKASYAPLGEALEYTESDVLTPEFGERPETPDVVVLLSFSSKSDAASAARALQGANKLHSKGANIIAVGVGPRTDRDLLQKIGYTKTFIVDRFEQLEDLADKVADQVLGNKPSVGASFIQLNGLERSNKLDIALVVEDTKWSRDETSEKQIKDFLVQVVDRFNVDKDNVRVALQKYNDVNVEEFKLNQNSDKSRVEASIQKASFTHKKIEYAPLGAALDYTADTVLTADHGDRADVPDVVVLLTYSSKSDDATTKKVLAAAEKLRNKGAKLIVVGVGSRIYLNKAYTDLLNKVADQKAVIVERFEQLDKDLANKVAEQALTSRPTTNFIQLNAKTSCTRCAADVALLVDESTSVMAINFQTYVKPFITKLSRGFEVSREKTHFSLIHFSNSDKTRVDLYLNSTFNQNAITDTIKRLPYETGNTAIVAALTLASTDVFTERKGARVSDWGKHVAPYAIVITDGVGTDGSPNEIAQQMLKAGIQIYVVAVGHEFTQEYLEGITSDPKKIYAVEDYSKLNQELLEKILSDTCCPIQ